MADRSIRPPPLIEIAVEAKTRSDQDKLLLALAALAATDPDFVGSLDELTGQAIIRGVDEQHLEELDARLRAAAGSDLRFGAPQIAYRETITRAATIDYTHKKLTSSSGQFARVTIAFEPLARDSGFIFENRAGDRIPAAFVPGIEKGVLTQKESGLIAGFPLIDIKATLIGGAYHDLDSNVFTFEIAARAAVRELAGTGDPILLEPVMWLSITTPKDCLNAIYADLDQRRADVLGTVAQDDLYVVSARTPLSHLFGYANTVRALSTGRAAMTMTFDRYEPIAAAQPSDDDPHAPPAGAVRMAVPAAHRPIDAIARPKP